MQGTIRPSVPWCLPVQEAGQQHQQQPKPAHQKQRSSNNQSSSRAAYSRSRVAGRPCGHSCQELPRAGNLCFLTRVSEGTLGLVDYYCRAPFRPSVPWCFPVREVRFLVAKRCGKQLQQPQQKQRSSNNQSSSRAAYSRSRAAGRPCGQVAKSCQELEIF